MMVQVLVFLSHMWETGMGSLIADFSQVLAVVGIWTVSQQVEGFSLLSVSLLNIY